MLCAKCHKNEATVHFTTVVNGQEAETVDLCKDCAPDTTGLQSLDPKELEKLSVIGKKCEFCGNKAFSGQMMAAGGAIYWCFDCGVEFGPHPRGFARLRTARPHAAEQGGDFFLSLLLRPRTSGMIRG